MCELFDIIARYRASNSKTTRMDLNTQFGEGASSGGDEGAPDVRFQKSVRRVETDGAASDRIQVRVSSRIDSRIDRTRSMAHDQRRGEQWNEGRIVHEVHPISNRLAEENRSVSSKGKIRWLPDTSSGNHGVRSVSESGDSAVPRSELLNF